MSTQMTSYHRTRERVGPVPVSTKIFQGIGAVPDTFKNFAFGTFLLFYYNQVLGMQASLASLAIMVALVIDAISDPLVGSFSDNLKTRLGRRHPLMYAAALPLGLCLSATFMPPAGLSETGLFIWLTVFAIATRVSMTLYLVPWGALFAEFSDDYTERTTIVTYRHLCGWIAGVTFTFLTWTYIFPTTEAHDPGHLNPEAYGLFALIVGGLVTLAVLLTTHLTRREIPYLRQPTSDAGFSLAGALNEVLLALRNSNFVILFISVLLFYLIAGSIGALDIYLNTYFWGLKPEDFRWFTLAIVGSMTAFVLIYPIQKRYDKKRIIITGLIVALIDDVAMVSLRFLDVLPANGELLLLQILVANAALRACAYTVVFIVVASMVADVLDAQELRTGRRQEGVFNAALSFAAKATGGFGILIGGLVLDFVIAFPRGAEVGAVEVTTVRTLGIIAGIAIPLLSLIPIALLFRYGLSREDHTRIRAELDARAESGATGYPNALSGDPLGGGTGEIQDGGAEIPRGTQPSGG